MASRPGLPQAPAPIHPLTQPSSSELEALGSVPAPLQSSLQAAPAAAGVARESSATRAARARSARGASSCKGACHLGGSRELSVVPVDGNRLEGGGQAGRAATLGRLESRSRVPGGRRRCRGVIPSRASTGGGADTARGRVGGCRMWTTVPPEPPLPHRTRLPRPTAPLRHLLLAPGPSPEHTLTAGLGGGHMEEPSCTMPA